MKDCDSLIGTPYSKMDCWQLVRERARQRGIHLPDYTDFTTDNPDACAASAAEHLPEYLPVAVPKPGDLVLFKLAGTVHHVGIVEEDGYFLHTSRGLGAQKVKLSHSFYRQAIKGFYRCPKCRYPFPRHGVSNARAAVPCFVQGAPRPEVSVTGAAE